MHAFCTSKREYVRMRYCKRSESRKDISYPGIIINQVLKMKQPKKRRMRDEWRIGMDEAKLAKLQPFVRLNNIP